MRDKPHTLRKNKEFQYVYRRGKAVSSRHMVVVYVKTGGRPYKMGLSVSKKVGNSVQRNRVKRVMRESIRTLHAGITDNWFFVVIARPSLYCLTFDQTLCAMRRLLTKAGIYLEKANETNSFVDN